MSPSSRPRDAKVMVSNLPLLFAKGNPTTLETMSLEELQIFLRFIMKCELNLVDVNLDTMAQPEWWPPDVMFGEKLLSQKEQRGRHSVLLRGVIRSCYTFHNCMYLLEFCRKLITFTGGVENLLVVDNCDGTRSLLNRVNKKLLVTFRAENQDYDKNYYDTKQSSASFHTRSPLKQSDSKRLGAVSTTNVSDPALSACVDVYLCDTCDKDFDSLEELLQHEKRCGNREIISPSSKYPSQDQSNHDRYFQYLKLFKSGSVPASSSRKIKESERPRAASYAKFMDIDVASPLGSYIVNSSGLGLDKMNTAARGAITVEQYLSSIESQCGATIKSFRHSNAYADLSKYKFPTTYRSSRKKSQLWSHTYCFTKAEKALVLRVIEAGLSLPGLKLWRHCQKNRLDLKMKRLDPDLVASIKRREEAADLKFKAARLLQVKNESEPEILTPSLAESSESSSTSPVSDSSYSTRVSSPQAATVSSRPANFFSLSPPFASPRSNLTHSSSQKSSPQWTKPSYVVKDEADLTDSKNDLGPFKGGFVGVRVPRPLPELQRIAAKSEEAECIDLCSSDED